MSLTLQAGVVVGGSQKSMGLLGLWMAPWLREVWFSFIFLGFSHFSVGMAARRVSRGKGTVEIGCRGVAMEKAVDGGCRGDVDGNSVGGGGGGK